MADARPALELRCHLDEVLPLARLLRASYVRDQPDFAALLPDEYSPDFLSAFDGQLAVVAKLVPTATAQAKNELLTGQIKDHYAALPQVLDRLAARLRRAENLSVPAPKFGIEAARQARNRNDHPELAAALSALLQNVAANAPALAKKGHTAADTAQLQALHDGLVKTVADRGTGQSTQRLLTQDNLTTINAFAGVLKHLMADGKALYARTNQAKLADYTFRQLLKRVRRERQPHAANGGAA